MRNRDVSEEKRKDFVRMKTVNGEKIMNSFFEKMRRFLSTDGEDLPAFSLSHSSADSFPNFLNDGVIVNDFLSSSLGKTVIEKYAQEIADSWEERLTRERKFPPPYRHPSFSHLSAAMLWEKYDPYFSLRWEQLQHADSAMSEESVHNRLALFLLQRTLPAVQVKEILLSYERMYQIHDPQLREKDLSLFGHHTVQDWFGEVLVDKIVACIIHGAALAEEEGYSLAENDVKADIQYTYQTQMHRFMQKYQISQPLPQFSFHSHLIRMGVEEKELSEIWKKVLLFRKWISDRGNHIFVDPLLAKQFVQKAMQTAQIELYQLPPHLQIRNKEELYAFQIYLSRVASSLQEREGLSPAALLEIPTNFLLREKIVEESPSLVKKRYYVHKKHLTWQEVGVQIAIQEVRRWIFMPEKWEKITQKRGINGGKQESTEEVAKLFFTFPESEQRNIEHEARKFIAQEDTEWVRKAFSQKQPVKEILSVRKEGGTRQILGTDRLEENQRLLSWLEQKPIDLEEKGIEDWISLNGEDIYAVTVLEKDEEWSIVSYEEAQREGILSPLVEEDAEKYYSMLQKTAPFSPFMDESQQWKPFSEIREQLIEHRFLPLIRKLEEQSSHYQREHLIENSSFSPSPASFRLYSVVQKQYEQSQNGSFPSEQDSFPSKEKRLLPIIKDVLSQQWKMHREMITVKRSQSHPLIEMKTLFQQPTSTWSPIQMTAEGNLFFFYIHQFSSLDSTEKDERVWREIVDTHWKKISAEYKAELLKVIINLEETVKV